MKNKVILAILKSVEGIIDKFLYIIATAWGWFMIAGGVVLNYFLPAKRLFHVLFALLLADAFFGLWVAKRRKEGFISDKMRGSFYKLFFYLVLLCLVFVIENELDFNLTLKTLFAISYAIELFSIAANMLILKPDMPLLRLLSGVLIGEIANKTGLSKGEVKEVFKDEEDRMRRGKPDNERRSKHD